jgi:hypothetical protein
MIYPSNAGKSASKSMYIKMWGVSDTKEDGRAAVEMGIDIVTYRARIGGFGLRKKMDRGVQVKEQESSLTIGFWGW